jgi:hypothetical protein
MSPFLGYPGLAALYAEHRHRDFLVEAELERRLALIPASRPRWVALFARARMCLQVLLSARTRLASTISSSIQAASPACSEAGDKQSLFLIANEWGGPEGVADGGAMGQVLTTLAPAPGAGWP